ncbi:MAG: Flagellar biosynthetic protein FlhB [Smithella sp. PtaU1.Bin162]|nr:MAG: Flagellar biosynthetic protein FlhB [Smithella sp. PtaU1.Bin162]
MKGGKDKKKEQQILAAAIKYDSAGDNAPKVTARGRGVIAEKIIELARENNIPIKNDPEMIQILSKLEVGAEIPVELYRAVAEILAYIYSLNESLRPQNLSDSIK